MAVAHALQIANGNPIRSAMTVIDMDGTASFLTGTVLGVTAGTTLAGVDVDAAAVIAFTSAAAATPKELVIGLVEALNAALTGGTAWYVNNLSDGSADGWVVHVEAIHGLSDYVTLVTPTFVPAV
jgi:hypothetical protein